MDKKPSEFPLTLPDLTLSGTPYSPLYSAVFGPFRDLYCDSRINKMASLNIRPGGGGPGLTWDRVRVNVRRVMGDADDGPLGSSFHSQPERVKKTWKGPACGALGGGPEG